MYDIILEYLNCINLYLTVSLTVDSFYALCDTEGERQKCCDFYKSLEGSVRKFK